MICKPQRKKLVLYDYIFLAGFPLFFNSTPHFVLIYFTDNQRNQTVEK